MMKHTLFAILSIVLLLASCSKQTETKQSQAELKRLDSLALHVAIYPSEGCLPFYYAEATGIYDSLGVDVRFRHLASMEQCDVELQKGRAEMSACDVARLICMRKDGFKATAIAQLPGSLSLLTAKGKRLNEVKQLKEHLVGMERHSESDYQSDKLLESTSLDRLDLFRTQFNKHKLREEMLSNVLIEAAFLDEPFATLAEEQGAKRIWTRNTSSQPWTALIMTTSVLSDKRRVEQARKLVEGYQNAVAVLNEGKNTAATDSLLKRYFHLPAAAVDTLPQLKPADLTSKDIKSKYQLQPLKPVLEETTKVAKDWLVKRGWIKSSFACDSLFSNILFKK